MYICHICVVVCGGQKRVQDPWELELQTGENHLPLVLGTELRSAARAASTIHQEPSLYPHLFGTGSHKIVQASLELVILLPKPPEH